MRKIEGGCSVSGCSGKYKGLGFCNKHYQQFKKYGITLINSRVDFNEIVDKDNYYELIITNSEIDYKNKRMKEIGRAKIDKEDLDKVRAIGRWGFDHYGYVVSGHSGTRLHRIVMEAKEHEEIDHVNTGRKNRSDNRKNNLRVCNSTQNNYNQGLRKDNLSGYKGVSYHANRSTWVARITINKKTICLGYFKTPKEASLAYKKAAKEFHGKFYRET